MQLAKKLNEFYPIGLIGLCLFPLLVGCIINIELVTFRDVIINLIWLPLFSIPALLLKKSWPLRLASIIYLLVGIIEITHWVIVKGPITVTSILVLGNTNYQEASEFMSLKGTPWLLLLIPFVVLFVMAWRSTPQLLTYKRKKVVLALVSSLSILFIAENAFNNRLGRKGSPQIIKVATAFNEQMDFYREANVKQEVKQVTATSEVPEQTLVLVIGESHSKNHMSLYGYEKRTTPLLEKRNDIYAYTDVIASFSNTINAILAMLSEVNVENDISMKRAVDIIDVFASAGFETYWISNQSPLGIWENRITAFAKKSHHLSFVNLTSNSSMETNFTASYDDRIFEPFQNILKSEHKKKLIVLHLMGSHSAYAKRYPPSFDVFKGEGERNRVLAEYHNSVLYNDFILDSIFNELQTYSSRKPKQIVSCVYLSDHGENVYDEGDIAGHDYAKWVPKSNMEIPLLFWISESYASLWPKKALQIRSNRTKAFMTDDLFHTLMDLTHIESPYLDIQRSVISVKYDESRKRMLEDEQDYDLK
ncbi:MAG: sulfatase-like hydrolase/transferase [Bacteroidia bacterium]